MLLGTDSGVLCGIVHKRTNADSLYRREGTHVISCLGFFARQTLLPCIPKKVKKMRRLFATGQHALCFVGDFHLSDVRMVLVLRIQRIQVEEICRCAAHMYQLGQASTRYFCVSPMRHSMLRVMP